jgi:hypothetical protein
MLQFLKDADDGGNFSANNEDKEASMRGILLYVNIKILVTDLRMLSNWV